MSSYSVCCPSNTYLEYIVICIVTVSRLQYVTSTVSIEDGYIFTIYDIILSFGTDHLKFFFHSVFFILCTKVYCISLYCIVYVSRLEYVTVSIRDGFSLLRSHTGSYPIFYTPYMYKNACFY